MFPLSKCLHPDDLIELAEELLVVDAVGIGEQHPMRRWEYALALRACRDHFADRDPRAVCVSATDVGGAGSPFAQILLSTLPAPKLAATNRVTILDPRLAVLDVTGPLVQIPRSLSTVVRVLAPQLQDVVFALSVLEHVDDIDLFLYHLACLTAPGGLLFLTMDYWEGLEDTAHFHWMRERIFNPPRYEALAWTLGQYGFARFGELEGSTYPVYHGPHVYDYCFVSLCLRKRA